MATVTNFINNTIVGSYNSISNAVPDSYKPSLVLITFIILVTLYAVFVWKFYRFLAKRDLLNLNLSQYNRYEGAFFKKTFAVILFILEYAIILPVVVFFWFFVIAIILIFLAKEQTIENILLISAVLVGAVRVTSYYNENLSKDLAKMFPFTILAVAILTPGFFELGNTLSKITQIPTLFTNIFFFLVVIMALEFTMRILYLILPHKEESEEVKRIKEIAS